MNLYCNSRFGQLYPLLCLLCCMPLSSGTLSFSPPVLVAMTTPVQANRGEETPIVPDNFFSLGIADGDGALLFGVHDPVTYDLSADGGATWAPSASTLPFSVAAQIDAFVPLYASAGLFAHPIAYHNLGECPQHVTVAGWELANVTTVQALAGGVLSVSKNVTAKSVFSGVPAPGLNVSATLVHLPRIFGPIRLADGSYLLAATATFAGVPPHSTPDGTFPPTSLLAFASSDTFNWHYQGTIANISAFSWSAFGPNESDLVYDVDGSTLVAIIRMDGDSDCSTGTYRDYYAAYSKDAGATWTLPSVLPGLGCVRPKLVSFPGGPLILAGGRNCVAGTKDISVWASATGAQAASWVEYSISYQHNNLWHGNASYLFDARVNETTQWETQSYTSVLRTSNTSFAIFYNRFFGPQWPPWPSATFMMQVEVQ